MYTAKQGRYGRMIYNRCGKSGLMLPALSLGMWHNFGSGANMDNMKKILFTAFDNGITYFDLANNYGPEPGSAETNVGRILNTDLKPYRDELVIATKAGYEMWDGPYGDWGSRKYLISSLDQSLKRLGLEYVDIFYHHRPDPNTPIEETMLALDQVVRQGKALYVGISNYNKKQTKQAYEILKQLKTPFVVHQPSYSMMNRWIETDGLKDFLFDQGIGSVVYSPLQQGILTGKYINGIPADSRAGGHKSQFLTENNITQEIVDQTRALNDIALNRGQNLAQMALSWIMRDHKITSVLIGASRPEQILDNIKCLEHTEFTKEELDAIDKILAGKK